MIMEFPIIYNDKSIKEVVRLIGYRVLRFNNAGGFSAVRRLTKNSYPRFHLIAGAQEKSAAVCKLHLDRQKPLLRGAFGHNGEHEGKAIEEEVARIKGLL